MTSTLGLHRVIRACPGLIREHTHTHTHTDRQVEMYSSPKGN